MRSYLLRFPSWREGGDSYADDGTLVGLFIHVVETVFLAVVLPAVLFVLELPFSVIRSLFGRDGWVEAACRWPGEIRITWRTARSARGPVAAEIARRLEHGYDGLTPEGAERVEMTKPPGFDELDA